MGNFYIYYLRRPDKIDPEGETKSQPFYVGKGSNCRAKEHRIEAKQLLCEPGNKSIKCKIIYKLWKQGLDYEEDIFISDLDEQEAFELEKEIVLLYGRIDLGTGCLANLTDGGKGGMSGYIISEETREKLKKRFIGRLPWNTGKHLTEDHKRKVSDSLKNHPCLKRGHSQTEQTKEKIRQANLGKKLTPEHCKKISDAQIGRTFEQIYGDRAEEMKEKARAARLGKTYEEIYGDRAEGIRAKKRGKGHPHTEDAKRRIRESKIGNKHCLGRKHTPEAIDKMREAWARRKAKNKPVRIPYKD